MDEKVGFIGIGLIGTPMSRRVLRGGYPLVVYDVSPNQIEPLVQEGAEAGTSPKDVASRCKTILLSLPNSFVVEKVCLGMDGIIEGAELDTVVVDLTSGNPPHTARICSRLAEKGIHMIDVGLGGSVLQAEVGALGIIAGGDAEIFERARPILQHIGNKFYHLGPIGAGHMAKALNNFLGATYYAAACEALTVATKAGLDPTKVLAVFNGSGGRSNATERRIPNFWLKRDFSSRGGMAMSLLVKDLSTACGIGKDQGVPMFIADLIHQLLMRIADEVGHEVSNSSIALAFEKWAGIEVRGS